MAKLRIINAAPPRRSSQVTILRNFRGIHFPPDGKFYLIKSNLLVLAWLVAHDLLKAHASDKYFPSCFRYFTTRVSPVAFCQKTSTRLENKIHGCETVAAVWLGEKRRARLARSIIFHLGALHGRLNRLHAS